jgi:branched-subunit amino acid aminotransferase/4-amino-4-deoxychorismate lyase
MPGLAILDGSVMDAAAATIPATDEGFLRGDGVFEVVRLYDGTPFALSDHLERMAGSAANLRLPIDTEQLRADIEALLEAARPRDAALRLVVTRGGHRLGIVEDLPAYPPTIALATVEYAPTRILDGVKSLSYAANMLSTRIAGEQGADQALLVTPHGRVLEAPTCSFFCSFDGQSLVTPPLSDHILDSITRRRLLPLVDVQERSIALDELREVREAFLASTLREVHPVHAINGVALAQAPGPATAAASEAIGAHVAAELARA